MKDVKSKGNLLYLLSHSVLYHRVMSFLLSREALVLRLTLQCPLAISFLITSEMRDGEGPSGPTFTLCITPYMLNGTFDSIMQYLLKAIYFQEVLIVTANNCSCWLMPVIQPLSLECINNRKDHLRTFVLGGWDGEWSLVRNVLQNEWIWWMNEFGAIRSLSLNTSPK